MGPSAPHHGTSPGPAPVILSTPDSPEGPLDPPGSTENGEIAQASQDAPSSFFVEELLQESTDLEESAAPLDDTPDWAMGKGEQPGGVKHMGGWTMKVFTHEQQRRLGVNRYGEHLPGSLGLGDSSESVTHNNPWAPGNGGKDRTSDDDSSLDNDVERRSDSTDDNSDDQLVQGAEDGTTMPADDPWPWKR